MTVGIFVIVSYINAFFALKGAQIDGVKTIRVKYFKKWLRYRANIKPPVLLLLLVGREPH